MVIKLASKLVDSSEFTYQLGLTELTRQQTQFLHKLGRLGADSEKSEQTRNSGPSWRVQLGFLLTLKRYRSEGEIRVRVSFSFVSSVECSGRSSGAFAGCTWFVLWLRCSQWSWVAGGSCGGCSDRGGRGLQVGAGCRWSQVAGVAGCRLKVDYYESNLQNSHDSTQTCEFDNLDYHKPLVKKTFDKRKSNNTGFNYSHV